MQLSAYGENDVLACILVKLVENAVLVDVVETTCWSMFSARYERTTCWSILSGMP